MSQRNPREQLVAIAHRELKNMQADRIDLAPDVLEVPTAAYCDEAQFKLEVDRVFKRVPLALGFSSEFKETGAYRALTVCNVPVIMVRGNDGVMRSFVNTCSHRGNYVVPEGSGVTKRFRCGYHAWQFGIQGELISVFQESDFGIVDKSCMGLTPLPTSEVAGLVWVTLNPNSTVDIQDFLSGYGDMLKFLRFDDAYVGGAQTLKGPNWKVAYDGYRDFYHLPILHRASFGPDREPKADYAAWGPHVRVMSPKSFVELAERDDATWQNDELVHGVWTIFPNISIAGSPSSGYMVSMMFPGAQVTESITTQNFLRYDARSDEEQAKLGDFMKFMMTVVNDEDYMTGLNVQRALATGAKRVSLFGRNELGGQLFHRWVELLINTADEDLPAVLRNGLALAHTDQQAAAG